VRWLNALVLAASYAPAVAADGETALVTLGQIARRMGVSRRTVKRWCREGLEAAQPARGSQTA
jgi:predicted transcriptional regulator